MEQCGVSGKVLYCKSSRIWAAAVRGPDGAACGRCLAVNVWWGRVLGGKVRTGGGGPYISCAGSAVDYGGSLISLVAHVVGGSAGPCVSWTGFNIRRGCCCAKRVIRRPSVERAGRQFEFFYRY